jgi:hypothetical protein
VPDFGGGKILGQGAAEWANDVPSPILPQIHSLNLDLQDIARYGALDRDRPGEYVRTKLGLHRAQDRFVLRQDVEAASRENLPVARNGFDRYRVAGT